MNVDIEALIARLRSHEKDAIGDPLSDELWGDIQDAAAALREQREEILRLRADGQQAGSAEDVAPAGMSEAQSLDWWQARASTLAAELAVAHTSLADAASALPFVSGIIENRSIENRIREMQRRLSDAEAECAQLRADARRYRWLREESAKRKDYYEDGPRWMVSREFAGIGENFFGKKIDTAIDAALASPAGTEGAQT